MNPVQECRSKIKLAWNRRYVSWFMRYGSVFREIDVKNDGIRQRFSQWGNHAGNRTGPRIDESPGTIFHFRKIEWFNQHRKLLGTEEIHRMGSVGPWFARALTPNFMWASAGIATRRDVPRNYVYRTRIKCSGYACRHGFEIELEKYDKITNKKSSATHTLAKHRPVLPGVPRYISMMIYRLQMDIGLWANGTNAYKCNSLSTVILFSALSFSSIAFYRAFFLFSSIYRNISTLQRPRSLGSDRGNILSD